MYNIYLKKNIYIIYTYIKYAQTLEHDVLIKILDYVDRLTPVYTPHLLKT